MRVDVLPLPDHPAATPGGAAVVIDVLRATTTMTTALAAGCRCILPATEVEQAVELARPYRRGEALLCGERGGVKVEGFDLGNSPFEYTEEAVRDRVIILTTTNGTRALAAVRDYRPVYLGSFLNSAVLGRELASADSVTVVCSGNAGRLSVEDLACAGGLVCRLEPASPELTDTARLAALLFRSVRARLRSFVSASDHGRTLAALGFASDIEFALRFEASPILPRLEDGRVIR